ncbi:MAG: CapA family protein, partial [Spirochaetota bacterium]
QVDVCLVSHHVRLSNHREVEEYQRTFARTAAEAGADLVFGHGAHLNQAIERAGATPVFHCVGQFVFDYPPSRAKTDGIVLRLLVSKEGVRDLSFALAWRDEENNAGLVPHSSEPGRRQLAELREMSPGVTIRERGEELVLEEA